MYSMRSGLPSILTMSPSWETARSLSLDIAGNDSACAALWIVVRFETAPWELVRRLANLLEKPIVVNSLALEFVFRRPGHLHVRRKLKLPAEGAQLLALKVNGRSDAGLWANSVSHMRLVVD